MISNNDPNNDFPDMDKLLKQFMIFITVISCVISMLIYLII